MKRMFDFIDRNPLFCVLLFLTALVVAGQFDRRADQIANAYKRGVSHGILAARAAPLSQSAQAQIIDLCHQTWPDTLDAALARRRACGAMSPAQRTDQ